MVIIGVAVGSILACGGDNTTGPESTTDFIPLQIGTSFSYHSKDTVAGAVYGDHPVPDSDFTVRVLRDTTDPSGTSWAILGGPNIFAPWGSTAFYQNGPDGLREVNVDPGDTWLSYLVFLYPASRGQVQAFGGPVISSVDTVITVPAGTYHCLRYDSINHNPGPAMYWSIFLAPGTGIVQRIVMKNYSIDEQGHLLGERDRIDRLTALGRQ